MEAVKWLLQIAMLVACNSYFVQFSGLCSTKNVEFIFYCVQMCFFTYSYSVQRLVLYQNDGWAADLSSFVSGVKWTVKQLDWFTKE